MPSPRLAANIFGRCSGCGGTGVPQAEPHAGWLALRWLAGRAYRSLVPRNRGQPATLPERAVASPASAVACSAASALIGAAVSAVPGTDGDGGGGGCWRCDPLIAHGASERESHRPVERQRRARRLPATCARCSRRLRSSLSNARCSRRLRGSPAILRAAGPIRRRRCDHDGAVRPIRARSRCVLGPRVRNFAGWTTTGPERVGPELALPHSRTWG